MLCRHPIQTPCPQLNCSDTSPTSSACSDNASSTSDCDSEHDQVSPLSEQPPRIKKKRQRTTFSPLEVWELERAYRRQPYLLTKDEEDLVQRLGITAKSLKVKIFSYSKTRFNYYAWNAKLLLRHTDPTHWNKCFFKWRHYLVNKNESDNSSFDLRTPGTAFSGRHFHVTQRKSLEIQTCSITKRRIKNNVELNHCEMSSSYRVFYLVKLKPQN